MQWVARQSGMIWTLAGSGQPGFTGDGGPAETTCLCEPKSIALDGAGSLFIADSENHVIRKLDLTTGTIATVAGKGPEYAASEVDLKMTVQDLPEDDPFGGQSQRMPEDFLQLADLTGTVRFVVGKGQSGRFYGDGGQAVQALLHFPSAVAVDRHGHLYIADTMNHRVRKVDVNSGIITTVAGTGHRRFNGDNGPAAIAAINEPVALVVDNFDHLFIADQGNHRVRMVELETGIITTYAGTGDAGYIGDGMKATDSALSGPSGLALCVDGNLYIADTFNNRIRRVDAGSGIIHTVVGDGGNYRYQEGTEGVSCSISRPHGITLDLENNILLTDSDSHLIRRWNRDKKIVTCVAGTGSCGFNGDGVSPIQSSLNFPFGVAVDTSGNIYIADTFNHRVRVIAA
jgi:sugar lactone lactonase YvrE